jgi:hypothetical protein
MYKYLKNLVKEIIIFFLQIVVIYISKNINFKNKKNIFIEFHSRFMNKGLNKKFCLKEIHIKHSLKKIKKFHFVGLI